MFVNKDTTDRAIPKLCHNDQMKSEAPDLQNSAIAVFLQESCLKYIAHVIYGGIVICK